MQNELNIALIQTDLVWENPEQNRFNFYNQIKAISSSVDVVLLPEMFTTGFTMNAKAVAETMQGKTVNWMANTAKKYQVAIVGSVVITENNNFYNRLIFVEPNGKLHSYNKRHTFTLAGENKVYTKGIKQLIVNYKGWKFCPLVCYDLRFPVWARNIADYDVLLYVANWPEKRITAWNTLLKARAIENMSYCIGVNRVGVDGLGIEYSGNSAVYDVLGTKITNIQPNKTQVEVVTLQKQHIFEYRNKLRFLDDKDAFSLKI
ncbi:amidohydrolase [Seonamhaeicola algicola]|uniref:Omega-amidase YafV n=1 Tax=Seonamhaeicola algicola TaxID=1719036 RepID=A0A5C7AMI8_9FLAO|nr:amidohydrolase [Seonamhaeicola algicola]TXE09617.1 amidohydrolase [Seonamhaeicola algicola]